MKNTKIEELINTVGTDISGKWISVEAAKRLVDVTVKECMGAAVDPPNSLIRGVAWQNGVRASYESIAQRFEIPLL